MDQAQRQAQKVLSGDIDRLQATESALYSITMYGNELKNEGTVSDYMTSMNGLISKFARTDMKCIKPTELRWDFDFKSRESILNTSLVRLNARGGSTGGVDTGSGTKPITAFNTEYQTGDVKGFVLYHDHMLIIHANHDVIYIYSVAGNNLVGSTKVSGMKNPYGLCVAPGDGATHQLVVADYDCECLWWLRLEQQEGQLKLGEPQKHNLMYTPPNIVTNLSGHVLVSDFDNGRLYVYSQSIQTVNCVQLSDDVRPRVLAIDLSGDYVVRDQNSKLRWVNSAGQTTRCYEDKPDILSVDHMGFDGSDLLVVDRANHYVHVVTWEGRHSGHLLTSQQGIKNPSCIFVDSADCCLWLGHTGVDGKKQLMKVQYSPPHVTTLNMAVEVPKIYLG